MQNLPFLSPGTPWVRWQTDKDSRKRRSPSGLRFSWEGRAAVCPCGKVRSMKITKKIWKWILIWVLCNAAVFGGYLAWEYRSTLQHLTTQRKQMVLIQGENREITGQEYDEALAVVCDNGTFVGQEKNSVTSYRGIPFAEPPTGILRWKPPVDAGADEGVYEAYYYGKSCIQTEAETEQASLYMQGEDCLTLNVFCSRDGADESPKAVMVFFHGGAYGWGGTADPIYDGQNFAEAHPDIVLVTANYRIGLMGFMDFSEVPGGEDYRESGNLGLLDQVSALRWVSRNIDKFGGDPANVTIFGESAGASSVSLLPLIKDARGLFHRIIAESGSVAFTYSKEEAKDLTRRLLKETGAATMDDLLALSEADLMEVNEDLNDYNNFPERDGIVLPEDPYEAYAQEMGPDIEMLSGTNKDEARYWIGEFGGYAVYRIGSQLIYGSTVGRMSREDRAYADAFLALQTGSSVWNKTEFFNDLVFRVPAIRQAELHAQNGGRHYMYYWTKESAIEHYGACHAVELAYVFNNLDDTIFTGERADEKLAAAVQEMWVNFAKTGDPSTEDYVWPAYDTAERQTMILGDEIGVVSDPLEAQRVLTKPLLKYNFNGYYGVFNYALVYFFIRIVRMLIILAVINAAIVLLLHLHRRFVEKEYADMS